MTSLFDVRVRVNRTTRTADLYIQRVGFTYGPVRQIYDGVVVRRKIEEPLFPRAEFGGLPDGVIHIGRTSEFSLWISRLFNPLRRLCPVDAVFSTLREG